MTTPTDWTYAAAGVDVHRGEAFVDRIKTRTRQSVSGGASRQRKAAGGYAAVHALTESRYIAVTTDGVGTKVLLAHELRQPEGLGIDLVAMCANDLICVGATPTLFLDYFATGVLDLDTGTALIEGILAGCEQAGMLLVGGETAEMPDVYAPGHFDLAGFAVGELAPTDLLTGETLRPGQTVIGLAASGIHSNGLSLARKVLTDPADRAALLTPTRIYVKPVLSMLKQFPGATHGLVHVTGGGWRNLLRLNPAIGFEINAPLPVCPIFERLQANGVAEAECYRTFNMGMGLAIIVEPSQAADVLAHLQAAGETAQIIGTTTDLAGTVSIPGRGITLTAAS